MPNFEQAPQPEREQLKSSLQQKLSNFLDKMLEQAGLALEKAGQGLRNVIPSSVPTWPVIPLRKLLFLMRKHSPPDNRHTYSHKRKQPKRHTKPIQATT